MDRTNEGQRAFWNDAPGRNWAMHQAALDQQHQPALDLLLGVAAPAPGERVLDIGCGAGASSLAAADRVGPQGHVTGLDISAPLLERAREAARQAGAAIDFVLADAQVWSLAGQPFDLVLSRFGMMFFDDPAAAFANVAGFLRPGGRLVFVTWAGPEGNPHFRLATEAAVAHLGPPETPPDPTAPGPMALRDIGRVVGLLRASGLDEVEGVEVPTEIVQSGAPAERRALSLRIGALPRHLRDKGASDADAEAILDALEAAQAPFLAPDGTLRLPARLNIFRARRP